MERGREHDPLNTIFNLVVPQIVAKDWKKGVARCLSTKEVLVRHMKEEENMKLARARASMNVQLGWIAAELKIYQEF